MIGINQQRHALWIALIALLAGCRDPAVQPTPDVPKKTGLVGKWNWIWRTGGFAGGVLTPAICGCTRTLVFSADSSFSLFQADTLSQAGSYRVYTAVLAPGDSLRRVIYTVHGRQTADELGYPVGDTLALGTEIADGYRFLYQRAK
jgi:hypothetical protein